MTKLNNKFFAPIIKENKYANILIFLAFSTIVMVLLLCTNTFYWADDYAFINDLRKFGILQKCIDGYYNWDGRFFTLASFCQHFFLLNFPIQIVTFIWSLCFLTSGFIIFFIINEEINLNNLYEKNRLLSFILFPIILWFGAYKHTFETIYWATGGYYSLVLLFGSFWILYFLKFQRNQFSRISKVLFLIFSVIVGASTQNLSIALILLVLITIFIDSKENQKPNFTFNILVFFAVLFGLIFIVIAPGNWVRLQEVNHLGKTDFSILNLIKNYFFILIRYSYHSLLLIFIAVFGGISIGFVLFKNQVLNVNFIKKINFKFDFLTLVKNLKWLILALSTILPFVFIPNIVSARTEIYFEFFVLIFIISSVIKLLKKVFLSHENHFYAKNNALISYLFVLIILISCNTFVIYNFKKGLLLKQIISERETFMENSENKTIHLKPIDLSLIPQIYQFTDLTLNENESNIWIRKSQEKFYNLQIIVTK